MLAAGLREELFKGHTWIQCAFSQPRPLWAGGWAPGLAPTPETEPWGRSWGVQGAWAPVTEGTDDESRLDTYPGPAAG